MASDINANYDIILKTFLRTKKLEKCLRAIERLNPQPKLVIVSDDGLESDEKNHLYAEFKKTINLEVIRLEFDAGISKARNEAYKQTSAPHILLIDDDHYLPSNVFELKEVLDSEPMIGGVSPYWEEYGTIFCGASDIDLGDWVIRDVVNPREYCKTESGIGYYLFDLIPNSTLFRRECLEDILWDEAFIIGGEHLDFYIEHKKMGKWKFAVSPNYIVTHDPKSEDVVYNKNRTSKEKNTRSMAYLVKKHNIRGYLTYNVFLPKKRTQVVKTRRWIKKHLLPKAILWEMQKQDIWYDYRSRNREVI